jgi:hypothetical protein
MARLFCCDFMTREERLAELKALRKSDILEAFKNRAEFADWQAQVAPLLNFNQFYYSNFVAAADVATDPNLSSYTINPMLARLDTLMKQAITELEHDLTLVEESSTQVANGSDLDFAEICRRLRWKQWLTLGGGAIAIFLAGFFAGRFKFFQNLYDLIWNTFIQR